MDRRETLKAGLCMLGGVCLAVEQHSSLKVKGQITTYDSLHLRLDGVARLAAAMTSQLGKEGEFVACSTDEAGLRAASESLFLQRGSTIMEGGAFCGFRVYKA